MRKTVIKIALLIVAVIGISWIFNHVNPWAAIASVFVIILLILKK